MLIYTIEFRLEMALIIYIYISLYYSIQLYHGKV